ncbi:hypothetical protein DPMN_168308 [Dreissena polymorpha]|uniref:Uncharacterized protein n=1 Tax=Dreissena polymorpha TaxID=45954 RepID=A0A9D4IZJ1_DREPO|nr:hypothetical protein DPMN_168308 [Dreissena polymorpha]
MFNNLNTCTGIRPTEVTKTVLLTTTPNDDDPLTQNCKQIVEELSRFVQATKRLRKPILAQLFPPSRMTHVIIKNLSERLYTDAY